MLIFDQWFLWILGILLAIIGFLLRKIWVQTSNHLQTLSTDVGRIKEWQSGADESFIDIKRRLERIEKTQNGEK
jgi:hypothetical protein